MDDRVLDLLTEHLRKNPGPLEVHRLHGDASYRTYYRVQAGGKSWVVMQLPPGKSSVSEEITNLREKPNEIPFLNIQRTLKAKGIPVPEVYAADPQGEMILLEDCGDITLESQSPAFSAAERRRWYRRAIDLLIRLQNVEESDRCIAYRRSFDETLFNWEFDHFLEYGVEARLEIKISPTDRERFHEQSRLMSRDLARLPQVLTHRDFQSRNLMIQENRLRLLDFQDALMGPCLYDLVALLRDSYVTLPWDLVEELVQYYDPSRPFKVFHALTIQRKLKDAGRFVYIDRVKGNASFLRFIPTSLRYVQEAFERQSELEDFYEVLRKYVPEFR